MLGKSAITSEHVMVWKAIMTVEVVVPRSLPDLSHSRVLHDYEIKSGSALGTRLAAGLNEAGTDAKH